MSENTEVKGCVQIEWWRKQSFKDRRAKLLDAIHSQGYKTRIWISEMFDEKSYYGQIYIEVLKPLSLKTFCRRKLGQIRIWPYVDGYAPYTFIEDGGNFDEIKKLCGCICTKLNETIAIE